MYPIAKMVSTHFEQPDIPAQLCTSVLHGPLHAITVGEISQISYRMTPVINIIMHYTKKHRIFKVQLTTTWCWLD